MEVVLDDNGVLEYVKIGIVKTQQSDAQKLAQWKKDVARVKRIILEGVRDHRVSKLHGKETAFDIWKTLTELFENRHDSRKLGVMNKLKIKDKQYEVVFRNGRDYFKHISLGQINQIGIMIESLYILEEDACVALLSRVDIRNVVVEREHDRPLKMEPQPVESLVDQKDDDEEDQSETSSRRRVKAKWEEGEIATIPPRVRWGDVEPKSHSC